MLEKENLKKVIDEYVIVYSSEKNLRPHTIRNKKEALQKLYVFLDGKPLTLDNCRAFLDHLRNLGWKASSILDMVRMLRAFVNFLYRRKYIPESFSQDLIKPKVHKKPFDYVAPEIVEKIIDVGTQIGDYDNDRNIKIKAEMRIGLKFLLRTGLRISELININGNDLNLYDDPPTFYVNSKGGNRDLLPLPKDMIKELIPRIQYKRVFTVTEKTCNLVLSRGVKRLGIKARLTNHSLRHVFATNLIKNGVPLQIVSRLLRHSSVEITDQTYTHLDVVDLSLAINSNQTIVREGLTVPQTFDSIEAAIKRTGIAKDKRFNMVINRSSNKIIIKIQNELSFSASFTEQNNP